MGVTLGPALQHPSTVLDGQPEGAISPDGQILATYCHGLFDDPDALNSLLHWAGGRAPVGHFDPNERREADLNRLADAVEKNLDLTRLSEWLPLGPEEPRKDDK
jgi:adenosylcobyric acid synthase